MHCPAPALSDIHIEPHSWTRLQVKGQLDLMRRACGELEGCDDFVTLLQEVLKTGNRLNEGTMRGAAAGALLNRQGPLLRPRFCGADRSRLMAYETCIDGTCF